MLRVTEREEGDEEADESLEVVLVHFSELALWEKVG